MQEFMPVHHVIVPGVIVVAARWRYERVLESNALELVVLGEHVACLDAIIAHSGSLSQRIMGEAIEAEDVLSQSDWAGVNRFVLG